MIDILCAVDGCIDQPFITYPLPLCRRDALTISLNVTDILHATALQGAKRTDLDVDMATVAPNSVWTQTSHPPIVYFLANGDRVKIGTSTNITARVSALSLRRSNAQILLEGGKDLEDALHDHFQADRIGRTEWFALSPQIRDYVTRRLEANTILRQPILPPDDTPTLQPASIPAPPVKPSTAHHKILTVLVGHSGYLHRDQIAVMTRIEGSTLDNNLSKLIKAGKIHRQIEDGKEVRGMYAHGPAPIAPGAQEDEDTAA